MQNLWVGIGIGFGLSLDGGGDEAEGEEQCGDFHLDLLAGGVEAEENFPPASVFSPEGAEAICNRGTAVGTFIVVDDA